MILSWLIILRGGWLWLEMVVIAHNYGCLLFAECNAFFKLGIDYWFLYIGGYWWLWFSNVAINSLGLFMFGLSWSQSSSLKRWVSTSCHQDWGEHPRADFSRFWDRRGAGFWTHRAFRSLSRQFFAVSEWFAGAKRTQNLWYVSRDIPEAWL